MDSHRAPVKKGKSLTATPLATPPPPASSLRCLPIPRPRLTLRGQSMVEHLSFANEPRPFKDPNYRKNANRRNKALKQIIAGERIRARQAGAQRNGDATAAAAAAAAEAEASGSGDGGNGDATEDGAVRRPGQKGAGPSKKTKAAEAAAGPVGIASEADYLACAPSSLHSSSQGRGAERVGSQT